MLQQTRAQTVIPYYHRFLERFPDASALARAAEPEVLTAWSGLGYYSRARNLQAAARQIVAGEKFPRDYDSIRQLPGVGPYTAAAVASIAFEAPHAAVDGNVLRVMARIMNEPGDITNSATKRRIEQQAQALLDRRHPGTFNQAMMELGATVCVPRAPKCPECPVSADCQAHVAGTERELPVKRRKAEARKIEATLAVIQSRRKILLWQRDAAASRMPGFWELPAVDQIPGLRPLKLIGSFRHTITDNRFLFTVVAAKLDLVPKGFSWHSLTGLDRVALSTVARKAIRLGTPRSV
jgi:A/G-specific adenine glycosylase